MGQLSGKIVRIYLYDYGRCAHIRQWGRGYSVNRKNCFPIAYALFIKSTGFTLRADFYAIMED